MRKLFSYIFFLLILNPIVANSASFIEGLEDVPLMQGLEQQHSDAISFGNEESRLIESTLIGKKVKFASVEKFYQDTLPQMGWKIQGRKKNTLTFYRDRETLEITRIASHPLTIRITVKSKN